MRTLSNSTERAHRSIDHAMVHNKGVALLAFSLCSIHRWLVKEDDPKLTMVSQLSCVSIIPNIISCVDFAEQIHRHHCCFYRTALRTQPCCCAPHPALRFASLFIVSSHIPHILVHNPAHRLLLADLIQVHVIFLLKSNYVSAARA